MNNKLAHTLVAVMALSFALAGIIRSQETYPILEYQPIAGTHMWKITPDYPNPPPLRIKLNGSTILEYTILSGYETNFRSGPKMVDIIAKSTGSNKLNLAWLVHDINYDGYLQDRKMADRLLFSMLLDAPEMSPRRAKAVYYGVRFFGKNRHCKEEKPAHACANNSKIQFKVVPVKTYKGSLQSIESLPTFELQTMRLTLMTEADKNEVREEIRKLFPEDADAVIKEMEE